MENNPFEAVRGRSDLNGLQKIREVLAFDRADRRNIMVALDALTRMPVLCAAVFLSGDKAVVVISVLLVILSVLGAFETSTVQACIPQMLDSAEG